MMLYILLQILHAAKSINKDTFSVKISFLNKYCDGNYGKTFSFKMIRANKKGLLSF